MNRVNKFFLVAGLIGLSVSATAQSSGGSSTATQKNPITNGAASNTLIMYPHGYNSQNRTAAHAFEGTDTVMVGATGMHYFVMPDLSYNKKYAEALKAAGDTLKETALTESKFDWVYPASGVANFTHVNPNRQKGDYTFPLESTVTYGESSPHITIDWTTAGDFKLSVTELPTMYQDIKLDKVGCPGSPVEIDVVVINPPSVMFKAATDGRNNVRGATTCDNSLTTLEFELAKATAGAGTEISKSNEVDVYFTIKKDIGDYASTKADVHDATNKIYKARVIGDKFSFDLNSAGEPGIYTVTLIGISDRISRKCLMGPNGDGILLPQATGDESVFTYTVAPVPSSGDMFHVPNHF